ncbi:protocadherin-1-like [Alosa pseudoharengus]|uniref:protocadherin-1-like n=1 Tax=Alosa pseudoharengus TaxID=34774 RepID=UPI003F8C9629
MSQRRGATLAWITLLLLVSLCSAVTGIQYQLNEEMPPNTLVGSLASDQGLPDTGHLYKLEVGAPYLRVDGKTGDIYTTEVPIDRETLKDCRYLFEGDPCYLEFEVSITDLIKGQSPRLIEGRIEIMDLNDNTPQFSSPILSLSIPENTHVGTLFPIPTATDKDSGSNSIADYSLTAPPDAASLFSLQVAQDTDEKLPQLIVLGNLDREARDSYDLSIKVSDGGQPARYSSALLRVTVTDVNDNPPRFERSHYEAELLENSPTGHSVLQVKANDSDTGPNGEVTYSLHQASAMVQRLLNIDRTTGIIYVKGLVDREEVGALKFYVVAKDQGPPVKSSKVQVTITIKDQNDNAPTITIRGIGLVTHEDGVANISEDTPVGTPVALVEVSDRDEGENAIVTCVVAGDVPFQLTRASESANEKKRKYFLRTTTLLDYERIKDYRIEIVGVDSGNPALSSTNSLKVQVTDTNDNAPIFSPSLFEVEFAEENQPGDKVLDVVASDADSGTDNPPRFERSHYEAELLENSPTGHSVLQVKANDSDTGPNGEVTYSLHQASAMVQRLLNIDRTTGIIYVKGLVDREEVGALKFYVVAKDQGPPVKSSKVQVTITIKDQNDNAPTITIRGIGLVTHEDGVANISEDTPVGTPVALVEVSDRDEGENAIVTCVVAGDVPFQLTRASESANEKKRKYFLRTTTLLDYERIKDYRIEIVGVDSGNPALSSTNSLKVQVTDTNDNAPIFSPSLFEVEFAEENQPGDKVLDVVASDADSGTNAELTYSIIMESSIKGLFEINANTGEIRVLNQLDREHKEQYEFHVAAADKGVPSQRGTATVVVRVLDRNDNDPKFMLSGYNFSVLENMPPLSPVGMVTVMDTDKGDNAKVSLSVEPDNGNIRHME